MLSVIYHPIYSDFPLPDGHRYPLQKYQLLKAYIDEHALPVVSHLPKPLHPDALTAIHDPDYVNALITGTLPLVKMRRIGFPWSAALLQRSLTSLGGTVLTVDKAIEEGVAIHLTGGYHHAHYDFGSGFCLFNDLVLAADHALKNDGIEKVLIVDCDVHQGDGTATLAAERHDIVTFSVHCEKNFPSRKPDSDIDLPLERQTNSKTFLDAFIPTLERAVAQHQPDMIIYDAGVDIHEEDELGYLSVSQQGIAERDMAVFHACKRHHLPVAAVIGGGYRTEQTALVPLHAELIHSALAVFYPHLSEKPNNE
ncbi:histone deacetylase family protein [Enterovibrio norvegicus]|uniref:Acetoin utilization deacetylase AcuC n=1 Tax=Enterovibrio norvegicus DSM 15893 TaxID=1121869 RepID=A0A1I5WID4_9GAMM|nr:histone deacetylase [Enterovibrio norvegicus]SFQ19400.1 Acetoin utilization deacetylase AcuC [Enterovibrio norvegicus DSM 15893]